MSTTVCFGPGAALGLAQLAAGIDDERRLLVLAGHSATGHPWLAQVRGLLPAHVFATLPGGYPTRESIGRITRLMVDLRTGPVIAIGGGSVLDTAKAAAAGTRRHGVRRCPVTAVPTTPGTGAEMTPFATVWDPAARRKESYQDTDLAPDAVVLDPELTRTLDANALAGMVFDALAQGMEAAWSTRSTPESIAHGIGAVSLAAGNLERVLADPDDMAARGSLCLAGFYSGRAIAIAHTTVCHALSYPLTLNHGVPHGHACAMTLAAALRHNAETTDDDCQHPLGAAHVRSVIDRVVTALRCTDVEQAARRLDELMAVAGLARFGAGGYDAESIATDAQHYDRADNNPRRLDRNQLIALLQERA